MHCDVEATVRGVAQFPAKATTSAMFLKRAAALLGLAIAVAARSSTGDSVLVVHDATLDKDSYSIFFDGLTDKGYNLTFRLAKDAKPVIIEDEVAQFSHVVIFAPDSKSMCPLMYK